MLEVKYSERETYPSVTLSTSTPIWIVLSLDPKLWGYNVATNCLSYTIVKSGFIKRFMLLFWKRNMRSGLTGMSLLCLYCRQSLCAT